jgi:hypothetical protein
MAAVGLGLVVALAVPALAGCSGAVQGAVEKAAGNAIGGNVDINSGGLSVTDSNGNEVQIGADVTIPDNWPAEVPRVEGGKLVSVMVAGDGSSVNAMWTVSGAPADAAKAYGDALTAAGYAQDQTTSAGDVESTQWTGNGYRINVIASGTGGETSVLVNAEKA